MQTFDRPPVPARQSEGSAQCFARFAPESIRHYLEHVWLGLPVASREALFGDHERDSLTVISVAELPAHRANLLDAMIELYGGERETHARALLSQWSKYYFGFAATAGFVAAALLRRPLVLSPDNTQVVLRSGLPVALILGRNGLATEDEENGIARRYAPLVDHLHTVIEMLCAMTKIAPRVLWSNAGNLLDYLFEQCAPKRDLTDDAAWLFGPLTTNGDANPLRLPVRLAKPRAASLPDPFSARRVCCVRYEIPG